MKRVIGLMLGMLAMASVANGQMSGMVVGSVFGDGKPVVGATVLILGTAPVRGAVVKRDGRYLIGSMKPGEYVIQVKAVGYRTQRFQSIEIEAGQEVRLDVDLLPAYSLPSDTMQLCTSSSQATRYERPLSDSLIILNRKAKPADSVRKDLPLLNEDLGGSRRYPGELPRVIEQIAPDSAWKPAC